MTKTQNFKILFDHGAFCEIEDSEGNRRRFSHEQVSAIQKLMPGCQWHTVVFKDYSQGPMKAEQFAHT